MPPGIKHLFASGKTDGADATIVQPSDWNDDHVINELVLGADITPTALAGNTDNWAPTSLAGAAVIRVSASAAINLTGLTGGADGRIVFLENVNSFAITLKHDVTSTAANRFYCPGQIDDTLLPGSTKQLIYDGTASRWRVVASANPITVALNANATANATTTAAKITALDLALPVGTYMFDYWIVYQSSALTTGAKFDVNFTGTVTRFVFNMYFGGIVAADATAGHSQAQNLTTAAPMRVLTSRAKATAGKSPTISVDVINADMLMRIEGMMIVTVAGNIELYHGSETANSTQVMAGTSLILTKTA
jgi:hypothetical protein